METATLVCCVSCSKPVEAAHAVPAGIEDDGEEARDVYYCPECAEACGIGQAAEEVLSW